MTHAQTHNILALTPNPKPFPWADEGCSGTAASDRATPVPPATGERLGLSAAGLGLRA